MPALLESAALSGRPLLWLDYTGYAGRLLAGGDIPWRDASAFIAWQRKAQGLLKSDVIALPLAPCCAAWLDANPSLREAMGAKRRAVFPIRTLLADEALRAHLVEMLQGLRDSFPKTTLALAMPSPRSWTALAYAQAHGDSGGIEIGADEVESAAVYAADFLRAFGDCGVDALLLEETPETEPDGAAEVEWYRPLLNVCAHYRWDCGLQLPLAARDPGAVDGLRFVIAPRVVQTAIPGIAASAQFWSGAAAPELAPGQFRFARIPEQANPESVLDRLALLR